MNERKEIIEAELIVMLDILVELSLTDSEAEDWAGEVDADIKAALSLYHTALCQLSEEEIIKLRDERLLKNKMGQIESVS